MSTTYMQYSTKGKFTGYALAQSIATQIEQLGHSARAVRGPAATDPDTMREAGDRIGHIVTTEEGKQAFVDWQAEIRAKRTA